MAFKVTICSNLYSNTRAHARVRSEWLKLCIWWYNKYIGQRPIGVHAAMNYQLIREPFFIGSER